MREVQSFSRLGGLNQAPFMIDTRMAFDSGTHFHSFVWTSYSFMLLANERVLNLSLVWNDHVRIFGFSLFVHI